MGVFSVHMQKFSTGDIKGLEVEVNRKSQNLKNQDINYSLSEKNIDLVKPKINLYSDTLNRVDELKKSGSRVQKNSVTCAGFVFTLPEDIENNSINQEKYFKICVEYLQNKFKKENVIQATVHQDESRPHLHVYLVPENKETGKLQARKSLDRNFLNDLHSQLPEMLNQSGFNISRGDSTDKYYVENIHDYKAAMKEIEKLKLEKSELNNTINAERKTYIEQIQSLKNDIDILKAEKADINGFIAKEKAEFKNIKIYIEKSKDDIKNSISYTSVPLSKNKVIVDKNTLEKVVKVARNTKLQRELNHNLEKIFSDNKNPLNILRDLVKNNLRLRQELEQSLSEAIESNLRLKKEYNEQLHLNKSYEALKRNYERLNTISNSQSYEVQKLQEENQGLKILADNNAERFKNVVQAINCLIDDEDYKVNLDKKRLNLLKAIEKYAIKYLTKDGYLDKADLVKNKYGISKGIQKEIDTLSKSYDLER